MYRSPEAVWAEIPKMSQKGLPGAPGPECQKNVEKVPKDSKKSQKGVKISVRGLFRNSFDTLGLRGPRRPFETFGGFRASGVWRLLFMGVAIVTPYFCPNVFSEGHHAKNV